MSVYRAMFAEPRAGVSDLGHLLGWPVERVRAALDELARLSLVRRSWEQPEKLVLVRPEFGLQSLLWQQEADLLERQQQLANARSAITRLISEFEESHRIRIAMDIEQLHGIDAIRLRIEEFAHECRHSVWTFADGGAQTQDNLEASLPLDRMLLERGIELRDIYLDSVMNDAKTLRHILRLADLGARIRTVPTLPTRMVLFDRTIALIPTDPDDSAASALVLRGSGAVTALLSLYEYVWGEASPLGSRAPRGRHGLSAQEQAVVNLLAEGSTDETIARRLGVSVRTARRITADLSRRLGARSRFQAGVLATALGWIDTSSLDGATEGEDVI
ncbi:LuxR C-terminal-related transcriptional regulator [Nocardiopsis sp. CNT312]|uniref:helix-turn-helix transcriptional regulator n=1 Tax=Nocardiopsis sp. CNT312 TaxID=1137268 RepID=UPI001E5D65E4|nr:LuxR C-terminal-related transcriptional regulator [Nocardiopsis sp. CNT312]